MNRLKSEIDKEINKIQEIEQHSDTTVEFETTILPEKQLCCWYRGNIAVVRSLPYVAFITATDDLSALCHDSAGNVLFKCYLHGKNDFRIKAEPFIRSDVDLLQSLKNEKENKNDIQLRLKTNRIELTILNVLNKKKKIIQSGKIDVLDAVNEAVAVLNQINKF